MPHVWTRDSKARLSSKLRWSYRVSISRVLWPVRAILSVSSIPYKLEVNVCFGA